MKNKFVFFIPPFTEQSAGIVCCHHMADEMAKMGEEVFVVPFEVGFKTQDRKFSYKTASKDEVFRMEGAVAVYPEVIHDNPLEIRNVARLILNRDGLLSGKKVGRNNGEFIVSFSKVYEYGDFLIHDIIFPLEIFNLEGALPNEERKLTLLYAGKNGEFIGKVEPPAMFLTRTFGKQDEVAWLLKRAKILYSADPMCFLNHEALLCGCAPVITDFSGYWKLEELLRHEIPMVYEMNRDKDFGEDRIRIEREKLIQKLNEFKTEFPDRLTQLVRSMNQHFSNRVSA
jgi:hypothetical protein